MIRILCDQCEREVGPRHLVVETGRTEVAEAVPLVGYVDAPHRALHFCWWNCLEDYAREIVEDRT